MAMQKLVPNKMAPYEAVKQSPKKAFRVGRYDVPWVGQEIAEAEAANSEGTVDPSSKPFVIVNTADFLDLRNDGGLITKPWLDDEGYFENPSLEFPKDFDYQNYLFTAGFNIEEENLHSMSFGKMLALRG